MNRGVHGPLTPVCWSSRPIMTTDNVCPSAMALSVGCLSNITSDVMIMTSAVV